MHPIVAHTAVFRQADVNSRRTHAGCILSRKVYAILTSTYALLRMTARASLRSAGMAIMSDWNRDPCELEASTDKPPREYTVAPAWVPTIAVPAPTALVTCTALPRGCQCHP